MREILFKAKRIDDGVWIEGYYFLEKDLSINDIDSHFITDGNSDCEVDIKTLSQYIGIKDKNGIRLFENDIIEIESINYGVFNSLVAYRNGSTCYETYSSKQIKNPDRWGGKHKHDCINSCGFRLSKYEPLKENTGEPYLFQYKVIGNIFDNKGLIK